MKTPITYLEQFVDNPSEAFTALWNDLDWLRIGSTPRREYFISDTGEPYTYGKGAGVRTYHSQENHPVIIALREKLETLTNTKFEVVFLNGYENNKDQLGWHADNSPEMDDSRPIGIINLGAEREIWFAPQQNMNDKEVVKLASDSLCLMHPGMQDTHYHRIPKAGYVCGPRISLTFRGYTATNQD